MISKRELKVRRTMKILTALFLGSVFLANVVHATPRNLTCEEYGFKQSCSRNSYNIEIDFRLNTLDHAMTMDHVRGCGWPPAHSFTEYGGGIKINGDGSIQLLRKPSEFSGYVTYGVLMLTENGKATFIGADENFEPQTFHCRSE